MTVVQVPTPATAIGQGFARVTEATVRSAAPRDQRKLLRRMDWVEAVRGKRD